MKLPSIPFVCALACVSHAGEPAPSSPPAKPFGEKFPMLDFPATGEWWKDAKPTPAQAWMKSLITEAPRGESVAFAIYTHDRGVLKLTAQMVPLLPDEPREVILELAGQAGEWKLAATANVLYPGWSAHFRIEDWDNTRTVAYRVRHGGQSSFEGIIRRDPIDKDVIVVASLSCNSARDRGDRDAIVNQLKKHDPDMLFFAGDQSYDHRFHTAAWLLFGRQFKEVLRDRPVITITDDHDIGQANLWGAEGKAADSEAGDNGGYFYPPEYVNMVERCQTWHLPDPVDPAPVQRGINVYFTNLRLGGIDMAILEDRKFKTGPRGNIPQMGPRPDHINDPAYDRKSIDLPGLTLLGKRQIRFLESWTADWSGAEMKAVLSQTAFCGAVHLHGSRDNRLLADLDSNGWPQAGRNEALAVIRKARAIHLCGDQHLGVVVQHGIDGHRDGPYGFANPAIHNTIYGRWWWPENEKPGANPVPNSPLPWTGDYLDGFGNPITMLAYANPETERTPLPKDDSADRGDGYGIVRFQKSTRRITIEAWPKRADPGEGDKAQFPGWPITISMEENDGRKPTGHLEVPADLGIEKPVFQVISEEDGEVLYTQRFPSETRQLPVYAPGKYTIRAGRDKPEEVIAKGIEPN